MKGKVTIELKDIKTGEINKIEGENTVTDAIDKIAKILGGAACSIGPETLSSLSYEIGMAKYFMPIAKKALGGLMLFNDTFSPSNIIIPSNVKVVASAGQYTNTTDIDNGSHVDMESGPTEHGYKNVWEFGTGQANGTIKSLSLTNFVGGFNKFSNCPYRGNSNISNINPVYEDYMYSNIVPFFKRNRGMCYYDDVRKEIYSLYLDTSNKVLKLYKFRMSFDSFKVNEWRGKNDTTGSGFLTPFPDPVEVASLQLTYTYSTYDSYIQDYVINNYACTDVENLRTTAIIPRNSSGKIEHYVEIDWTKILSDPTDPTAMVEKIITSEHSLYDYTSTTFHLIHRNKYYYGIARRIDSLTKYFIGILNLIDDSYEEISMEDYFSSFSFGRGSGIDTEGIWISKSESNGGNLCMHINWDGEITTNMSRLGDYKGVQIHPLFYSSCTLGNGYMGINNRYIGTYYEIPTPITKTNNQVMKITYELIDA